MRDPSDATSAPATIQITPGNSPPTVSITAPAVTARFVPGSSVTLRATATDDEDGPLPGSSLQWQIIRRHNTHTHPFLTPPAGAQVTITYPGPEGPDDVTSYLEATVTAVDSAGATATATIDLRPKDMFVVGDVATREGTTGTVPVEVPVTLHRQACAGACPTTTVAYATVAGTAAAGSDFVATSGTLSFAPAETTKVVRVMVKGDATAEPDERFTVKLSAPSSTARLADGVAEVLVLSDENPPAVPIRINVGGPQLTAAGVSWLPDRGYVGGQSSSVATPIAGTTSDALYHSQRAGHSGYHLVVPNGSYRVRLHFAEIAPCCTAVGQRVVDVDVEGRPAWDNFDILAEVPRATALVKEVVTPVTDGVLDVTFAASVREPQLAAIEVLASATSYDLVVTAVVDRAQPRRRRRHRHLQRDDQERRHRTDPGRRHPRDRLLGGRQRQVVVGRLDDLAGPWAVGDPGGQRRARWSEHLGRGGRDARAAGLRGQRGSHAGRARRDQQQAAALVHGRVAPRSGDRFTSATRRRAGSRRGR